LEPAVRPEFSVELPEPEPAETPSEPEPLTAGKLAEWAVELKGLRQYLGAEMASHFAAAWRVQNAKSAAEVERLQAELAVTANALERACTPPFPSRAGPPGVHSTLVNFYLRRAREAAEAKEADRGQGD
jgi:hypothetical protein